MTKLSAKISVVIPVFNYERFIAQAIDSVLNQTFKAHEIIVVDNASTDRTAAIIHSYSDVLYCKEEKRGTANALNRGLREISGDLIAFLDADDYWPNDKLEKQIKFLSENKEVEGVFGHHKRFYEKPKEQLSKNELLDEKRILPGFFKATFLIWKSSFDSVGMFNSNIIIGDFIDWYARAKDMKINMAIMPDIFLYRRIHDKNSSIVNISSRGDLLKSIKASLDRKRTKNL